VAQSHEICDRLEAALADALDGAVVTIHVEPDHEAKYGRGAAP
jgi:divalent metal cation (Fe/Co/Zn/Cd) transporter